MELERLEVCTGWSVDTLAVFIEQRAMAGACNEAGCGVVVSHDATFVGAFSVEGAEGGAG